MTNSVDELLAEASVLVVVGPGGVGKTTLAAAMAARAARVHDRRALVVTVDPARRLADALGVAGLAEEAVLVPVGSGSGRLWALMVDMAQSWDRLVRRHSPDSETCEALLGNRLYRTLSERFVQSHDYIALDRLVDLAEADAYDLVVIDTPPSVHALGVLDAPDLMIDFFGSRFLTWLTAPYRTRLVRLAAAPFMTVAERLLGGQFLAEIAEFFWLFARLQPDFVRRAKAVKAALAGPGTRYVVVETPEPQPAARAEELVTALTERGFEPSLRLVNRAPDPAVAELAADNARFESLITSVNDSELRDGLRALVEAAANRPRPSGSAAVQEVPLARDDVDSVDGLVGLLGPVLASESRPR